VGPRVWAAIGNVYRISAVVSYFLVASFGYSAIQLHQAGATSDAVIRPAALAVFCFVGAVLMWNAKGFMVSGNLLARLLGGLFIISWFITTAGIGLVVLGVVYLLTGEPDSSETYRPGKAPKSRFKPPRAWRATGRVGPSGATLYADSSRAKPAGIFDSWTPVQVRDKQNGLAQVVAASGEEGWIDLRTLMGGV
jgi:hypothetical protein